MRLGNGARERRQRRVRSRWFEIRSRTVILRSIVDRIVSFLDKLRRGDEIFFFFFTIRVACYSVARIFSSVYSFS